MLISRRDFLKSCGRGKIWPGANIKKDIASAMAQERDIAWRRQQIWRLIIGFQYWSQFILRHWPKDKTAGQAQAAIAEHIEAHVT